MSTSAAETRGPAGTEKWVRPLLRSVPEARRDDDVARMAWDHDRWPMDLESYGESDIGAPTQTFRMVPGSRAQLTEPYLNYLLCLADLSRHVTERPTSFLELGGGYGVLGEIVMSRDEGVRYVVSLNSSKGEPVAVGDGIGVRDQVVSAAIIEMFEKRGYELCATYNRPFVNSAGELAILRRR